MIFINKLKDNKKSLIQALSLVYGLNKSKIFLAARVFGLFPYVKIEKIDSVRIRKLESFIKANFITGKELRDIVRRSLKSIAELRNYRAKRLAYGLPCNGQRSRTNARTAKRLCRQQKMFLNSVEINKILGSGNFKEDRVKTRK
jgi:small subunit ribosomal protein S13